MEQEGFPEFKNFEEVDFCPTCGEDYDPGVKRSVPTTASDMSFADFFQREPTMTELSEHARNCSARYCPACLDYWRWHAQNNSGVPLHGRWLEK